MMFRRRSQYIFFSMVDSSKSVMLWLRLLLNIGERQNRSIILIVSLTLELPLFLLIVIITVTIVLFLVSVYIS